LAGADPLAPLAGVAAIAGAAASLLISAAAPSPPTLSVTVFDGGGTTAYLLRTPAGSTILIDGGRSPSTMAGALGSRLPFLTHQLTVAILTRSDTDRLPGLLGALDQYPVGMALIPPEPLPAPFTERWRSTLGSRSVTVREPTSIDLEPDLRLHVLPTRPVPAESASVNLARTLAIRLEYRNTTLLIGPGLNPESIRATLAEGQPLTADVWFVPRGAGPGSLDAGSLAAISTRLAIIPVNSGFRISGPDPASLALLARVPTYRTDINGPIEVTTDGDQVWVRPERS